MSEDQLQAALWSYFWNNYPNARHHMWAVPNSAIGEATNTRDIIRINTLKATGLLAGVWDLHLFWNGTFHIIETKVPGGQLTVTRLVKGRKVYGQKEWGEKMASHGAVRHIYHSLDEGKEMLKTILGEPCPSYQQTIL